MSSELGRIHALFYIRSEKNVVILGTADIKIYKGASKNSISSFVKNINIPFI